jgi:hypothetical protein
MPWAVVIEVLGVVDVLGGCEDDRGSGFSVSVSTPGAWPLSITDCRPSGSTATVRRSARSLATTRRSCTSTVNFGDVPGTATAAAGVPVPRSNERSSCCS